MWPYIVKHNPDVIKNPNNVPYGTTIKIPELTKNNYNYLLPGYTLLVLVGEVLWMYKSV